MGATFASFDELLIERVFQPACDLLAERFGVTRASAAGFCLDVASLGWIVARVPRLSKEVADWDATAASLHLLILLLGLLALTGLRTLFRRQAGRGAGRQANPLRQTMRPHRAVLLLMLIARLAQFQAPGVAEFADMAMLLAATAALYLGACAERPPVHRSLFATAPSVS
ncbi:MAG TPA: hypothetical protein VFG62_13190 [Rhodopila sp.]|jgi:hypothetical protein|nr:hypothetical protein [Rhodopila sp.]